MTFSELVLAVQSRFNLTSTESATRIGVTFNDRYKRITSAIGINLSRRTTVQANVTVGVSTLNFAACEKIINVVDRSATPYRVLDECTVEQLRAEQPSSNATPRKYAILAVDAHSVTILLDCVPQSAFTLYADCYGRASTLSGSQEPAFEEDFHDVLLHGALADEYRKMEKPAYARESEALYQERLSDLRMFRTKSSYLDIMQGGNTRRSIGVSGGSGGSGSSVNGASSYTQTGLITFDRTSAAPGSRYPFAVAAGSNKVANLDADLLDGQDWTSPTIVTPTLTVPVIASFASATHNHQNAAGGGTLSEAAMVLSDVTTNDVSTTKHGLVPKAPNLSTQVLIGTGAWGVSGQLVFPAVQNPSANANTLDDYEEGTWTPTWTSGGVAPSLGNGTLVGLYTKIGRLVIAHVSLVGGGTTTFGNAANAWTLSLPFTAAVGASYHGSGIAVDTGVANYPFVVIAASGGSTVTMMKTTTAVAGSFASTEPFAWGSTDSLTFTIIYPASA
jgi:hypothetical protein